MKVYILRGGNNQYHLTLDNTLTYDEGEFAYDKGETTDNVFKEIESWEYDCIFCWGNLDSPDEYGDLDSGYTGIKLHTYTYDDNTEKYLIS